MLAASPRGPVLIALGPDTNTHTTPELASLATKAACLQQRHRLCAHWGQDYVGTKGDTPVPAVTEGSYRLKGPTAPHAPLKPTGSRNPLARDPPSTQDQASPRPCPTFWSPGEVRPQGGHGAQAGVEATGHRASHTQAETRHGIETDSFLFFFFNFFCFLNFKTAPKPPSSIKFLPLICSHCRLL